MATHDELLDQFLADVPAPGSTPAEHLAHTLACFGDRDDISRATSRASALPITWGDLRALADGKIRPHLRLCLTLNTPKDEDWAVVATTGVYGPDARTGLTIGDLRQLLGR